MDKSRHPKPEAKKAESPVASNSEPRRRAHEALSAHRSHLDRLEDELNQRLQQLAKSLADEIAADHGGGTAADDSSAAISANRALEQQLDSARRQLITCQTELNETTARLEQARTDAVKLEQELRVQQALLTDARSNDAARHMELAEVREQAAVAQSQLAIARQRQQDLRQELATQEEQFSQRQAETDVQRRRIARKFKAEHAAHLSELDRQRADLLALAGTKDQRLETELAAALAQAREAQERLAKMSDNAQEHSGDLSQSLKKTSALEAELSRLREGLENAQTERDRLAVELNRATAAGRAAEDEVRRARVDHAALADRLAESDSSCESEAEGTGDGARYGELQSRFESAVEELRQLKRANAELESKLVRGRADSPAKGGDGLDWESQKRRLLASLEADDSDDTESVEQRHSIEGTIRITDQILTQKDQEITEFKRLLEAQSNSLGSVAVGAAAVADLLDQDGLVRQEREKLQQIQAEWRERIGKAEIDISVERAKIARDRAQLEEKIRLYQTEQDSRSPEGVPGDAGKPTRGRWLSRLGLKDLDQQ